MKRNNKDNSGYGKPSGNYGSAPRSERPDRENRSSSNRFFSERNEKPERSGKPPFNKTSDWGNKPERSQRPSSGAYGRGRNERGQQEGKSTYNKFNPEKRERQDGDKRPPFKKYGTEKPERSYGAKPSYNKAGSERGERSGSKPPFKKFGSEWGAKPRGEKSNYGNSRNERGGRPASEGEKRFGSEWKEKPRGDKSYDKRFESEKRERFSSEDKPAFKRFGGEREDKSVHGEFKTVYKGRGRDQKPRYETVRKEEVDQKRPTKKFFTKERQRENDSTESRPTYNFDKYEKKVKKSEAEDEIRLNRYIANSGVCSRREADSLIENGMISVNGTVVKELGMKVSKKDTIVYQGRILNPEKPVYVLLNKPKDYITTTDDPMERKTVMGLVENACEERIFPVGRLDRNTTGLLLFTNDGELADKLASPANKIKKIYQVTLDKALTKKDEETILEGLTLEDGLITVDDMQVLSLDRTILGLEIHVGRNRIVRRIFAHLGYDVVALDRVTYAGLTKKDLSRGNYRFLTEKEVINLKFFK